MDAVRWSAVPTARVLPEGAVTHVLAMGSAEARSPLSQAVDRLAELLRSLPDTGATIPGSKWTVG